MAIIFTTPRLILRQMTVDDASNILALNSDPDVIKYLHEPVLQTQKDALDIIENIILPQYKNGLGRWAMIEKETGEFLGWCGFKFREEKNEIDLGYRLNKHAWGKGYATEAAKHTLSYGFDHLNLDIITGRAHIDNLASLHVLEKIGMKYVKNEFDRCEVKTYEARR